MDSTKICKKYLKFNTAALWQWSFLHPLTYLHDTLFNEGPGPPALCDL